MAITAKKLPVIAGAVVIAGMIPSVVMLLVARDLHIAKVDDRPYVVSSTIDADRRTLTALHERGFGYALTVNGGDIIATMHGPAPEQVCLVLQRPDDIAADKRYVWAKTAEPLCVHPERPGRWHVRLEGTVDGIISRLGETAVDIRK